MKGIPSPTLAHTTIPLALIPVQIPLARGIRTILLGAIALRNGVLWIRLTHRLTTNDIVTTVTVIPAGTIIMNVLNQGQLNPGLLVP